MSNLQRHKDQIDLLVFELMALAPLRYINDDATYVVIL